MHWLEMCLPRFIYGLTRFMMNQIYKCILILKLSNKFESYDECRETAIIILAETGKNG